MNDNQEQKRLRDKAKKIMIHRKIHRLLQEWYAQHNTKQEMPTFL